SDNHLTARLNKKSCFPNAHRKNGSVGENFYKQKNDIPWKTRLEKKHNKTALLISITRFRESTSPVWNGFLDKVKEFLPKADFVVIDLRGNSGGDDTMGSELS